jgi:putative ABC transport system substrate-binding protein
MKSEAFTGLAADLVRRKVDVLLVSGPAAVRAAKDATSAIPIVALDLELRIELHVLEIRSSGDLDHALGAGVKDGSRALVQLSSPLFDTSLAKRIADFTTKHRLPAISMFRRFAEAGGLMSYGPDQPEYYKRLSVYIDKILKGAKPADLPIEQPTKFDFVINLKTAKAPGLTIPPSLLQRADQVIE